MSWTGLNPTDWVTNNNAQDAVNTGALTLKGGQSIPANSNWMTKDEANTKLDVNNISGTATDWLVKSQLNSNLYNCGTNTRKITIRFGETPQITRIYTAGITSIFKFAIIQQSRTSGNSGYMNFALKGGTNSGYNMIYFGGWGSIAFSGLTTYQVAQDVNYIDVVAWMESGTAESVVEMEYKIECPIAIGYGIRFNLHYAGDTTGHACNTSYIWYSGDPANEGTLRGFSGTRPYFVENGSLSVGNRIFALPTYLKSQEAGLANDDFMGVNDRTYKFISSSNNHESERYFNSIQQESPTGPEYYSGASNTLYHFLAREGYFSDGTTSAQVDNFGVIISIVSCGGVPNNHITVAFTVGNSPFYYDLSATANANVTSNVTITIAVYGDVSTHTQFIDITISNGSSTHSTVGYLDGNFHNMDNISYSVYSYTPHNDSNFTYSVS